MTPVLYFEDFAVGQVYDGGSYQITMEEAVKFARHYDPQYFHIDEEAALNSPFGKLAVCGVQTAAITIKLQAQSGLEKVSGGLIGLGFETLKWPRPTYPGDTLHATFHIVETRRSTSKPTHGVVRYHAQTHNQNGDLAMEIHTSVWVPCRNPGVV